MLGLALACGGLAASEVEQKARSADERVGPLVPVAVARADLPKLQPTMMSPAPGQQAKDQGQAPAQGQPAENQGKPGADSQQMHQQGK